MGPAGFGAVLAGRPSPGAGRQPSTVYGLPPTAPPVTPGPSPAVAPALGPLIPRPSASFESPFRNASSSVTSASSCWVTWGIVIQARWVLRPASFWTLVSASPSTSPHFEKSISGGSASVVVEIEVFNDFHVESEVGPDVGTSLGLKWKKDF